MGLIGGVATTTKIKNGAIPGVQQHRGATEGGVNPPFAQHQPNFQLGGGYPPPAAAPAQSA